MFEKSSSSPRAYLVHSRADVHHIDQELIKFLAQLKEKIPKQRVWFFTNSRKQLLKNVYKGLIENFAGETSHTLDVNKIKPGFLTSVEHKSFIEPNHVIIVLTKNHNHRQKMILTEVEKTKTPYTLIRVNDPYMCSHDNIWVEDVRGLYVLLYNLDALCNGGNPLEKSSFLNKYRFV